MNLKDVKEVFDIAREFVMNEKFMPNTEIPCDILEQNEKFCKEQENKLKFINNTWEKLITEMGKNE